MFNYSEFSFNFIKIEETKRLSVIEVSCYDLSCALCLASVKPIMPHSQNTYMCLCVFFAEFHIGIFVDLLSFFFYLLRTKWLISNKFCIKKNLPMIGDICSLLDM